jgi:hypothetical protein
MRSELGLGEADPVSAGIPDTGVSWHALGIVRGSHLGRAGGERSLVHCGQVVDEEAEVRRARPVQPVRVVQQPQQ